MPAATHLTCSMLSSSHPSLAYGKTRIQTMLYGDEGGRIHIGALDFLESEHSYSMFASSEIMSGVKTARPKHHSSTVRNSFYDLVIMNPPFTRPTNHTGSARNMPVPSFAGFRTTADEQKAMSNKLKKSHSKFGHGNAGLASNFIDLAHRKLKKGWGGGVCLAIFICTR